MLVLRFNIPVDMRGEGATHPDFLTTLGAPRVVMSRSPLSIVVETTTAAQLVVRGRLDYSSEEKLRDSPITSVGAWHPDFPPAMFQVSGLTNMTFGDFEAMSGAQLERFVLNPPAGSGYTVHGSRFDDVLVGLAGADQLFGRAGNDRLLGGAGNDVLDGSAGADRLDGGSGNDSLRGGAGDDVYVVDSRGDVVIELANAGTDVVYSSVGWTLGAQFEKLLLTGIAPINGSGNSRANALRGNSAANVLSGGAGDDVLNGGLGFDVLTGGGGHDNFVFADGGGNADKITDFLSGTDHLWLDPAVFAAPGAGELDAGNLRDSAVAADGNDFLVYDLTSGLLSYDASGSGAESHPLVSLGAGTVLVAGDIAIGTPLV